VNRFARPGPDLRLVSRAATGRFDYGFLPPSLFFREIKALLAASAKARRLAIVHRTE
jgi:hypothetical protein